MPKILDIVVPCYNESKNIRSFFSEVTSSLNEITEKGDLVLEFVFINDGSTDDTLSEIKKLGQEQGLDKIKYISFSKNFGKEAALLAGLDHAKGDFVVIMDADLQHPPSMLNTMYTLLTENDCDCVGTRRSSRAGEEGFRSFGGKAFYKLINRISDINIVQDATDFRMMKRKVVDAIRSLPERKRFTKGIYSWVGFKTIYIEFENITREEGSSKWSLFKLIKYAIDGITAFSAAPLKIATVIGFCMALFAIIYGLIIFIRTLIFGPTTAGFPTTIILMLLIGGITITILGVIGEYIARIFDEVKQRPHYIIDEANTSESEKTGY